MVLQRKRSLSRTGYMINLFIHYLYINLQRDRFNVNSSPMNQWWQLTPELTHVNDNLQKQRRVLTRRSKHFEKTE